MNLNLKTYGAGEPLLILHGLFGSLDNWHSVSLKLAANFRVLALDQRNHGHSPHAGEMNYELMAQDVAETLRTEGLQRAHVLGHSMGGKTAMQLALLHSDLVNKLIVVDIAPRAYPGRHRGILNALLALNLSVLHSRKQAEDALAPAIPDLTLRQFLLKSLARDPDGAFHWRLGLHQIERNYPHLSAAITASHSFDGPALFLRGETSDFVADTDLPEIHRLFPGAIMQIVPGTGHLPHMENQEAFLKKVTSFLK